ncbi:MAG: hypothetical protein ACJAXS_003395 [Colwellia sp.]|jgi:hypothetical protein
MSKICQSFIIVVLSTLFSACGGGSDSENTTKSIQNISPVANAGADQAVDELNEVSLSGSGTDEDGSITSYSWSQTAGTAVELTNSDTATATFVAPDVTSNEALTFQLSVTDNGGATAKDTVDTIVTHVNHLPVANAGADQAVDELNGVSLSGSGTDEDGSITSYSWSQTAGTAVELTNSDTATATFVAPDVTSNEALTFQLSVTDNDGTTAKDTVDITVNNVPIISITGSMSYDNVVVSAQGHDYSDITQNPIRGASINLLDVEGNIVQSTETDENGNYEIEVANIDSYSIEVVAELGNDKTKANYISVRDNFTASDDVREPELTDVYRYTVLPIQAISESLTNTNFNANLNWNPSSNTYGTGRTAPIFSLLDQAFDMKKLLRSWKENFEFAPLYIFWNENNVAKSGVWWNGEIPNSSFAGHNTSSLYVASDDEVNIDEYDRTIIAHELGHYVLINLGRDESIGGGHSLQSAMDHRQAFTEGFASYFSWLLTGSEELIDSDGLPNGVTSVTNIFDNPIDDFDMGWFYENVNSDILKNVTSGNLNYGLAEKGYSFVFDVLADEMKSSDAFISIHSFLGNSINRDQTLQNSLSDFAISKGINSVDEWGQGESYSVLDHLTINNLDHSYLPLYRDMEIGVSTEVCLNDVVAGSGNRLGVFAYLKLDIIEEGDYLIEWSSDDGPSSILSQNHLGPRYLSGGGLDDNAESNLYGSRVEANVPAELNIISISFYGNQFPNADARAPHVSFGCINLTISKN